MNVTFRLRKAILYQGIAFALIFLIVTLAHCSLFFLADPKAHGFKDHRTAIQVGCLALAIYGFMTLVSAYVLIAYFVERLSITGSLIHVVSVFQKKQFDALAVRELFWNPKWRNGRLRFRTTTSRAVLDLHGFARDDQLEIIRAIRRLVPEQVQTGWSEFCHLVALPLREGRPPRQPGLAPIDPMTLPETSRIFVTRRRYDLLFGSLVLIGAIGAFILLLAMADPRGFAIPFIAGILWPVLRFSTPKEGEWQAKWTGTSESKFAGLAFLALPAMFVPVLICAWFGVNGKVFMWIGILFMAIVCAVSMRHALRREKEQLARDNAEAVLSVKRWEESESLADLKS